MGALRVGAEIMADAGLEVEPWVEGAAVEELHLGLFRGFAEAALAFAFEPDFVLVDAVPALAVTLVAVAPLQRPVFDTVAAHYKSEQRRVGKGCDVRDKL